MVLLLFLDVLRKIRHTKSIDFDDPERQLLTSEYSMKNIVVVLTEPAEGREDDFNDYYENLHLDEVLATQEIRDAQDENREVGALIVAMDASVNPTIVITMPTPNIRSALPSSASMSSANTRPTQSRSATGSAARGRVPRLRN